MQANKQFFAWVFMIAYAIFMFSLAYNAQQSSNSKEKARQKAAVTMLAENQKQQDCLIESLWHESRSESDLALKAVLSVIINRKNSKDYPKTFCAVVHQPFQFSYYSSGIDLKPVPTPLEYDRLQLIKTLASQAVAGSFEPILLPDVLWFHNTNISTKWSNNLQKVVRIDSFNFYKEKT